MSEEQMTSYHIDIQTEGGATVTETTFLDDVDGHPLGVTSRHHKAMVHPGLIGATFTYWEGSDNE